MHIILKKSPTFKEKMKLFNEVMEENTQAIKKEES